MYGYSSYYIKPATAITITIVTTIAGTSKLHCGKLVKLYFKYTSTLLYLEIFGISHL